MKYYMANILIGMASFWGTTVIASVDKERSIIKVIHDPENILKKTQGYIPPRGDLYSANVIIKKIFENKHNRWY